jgi:protein subunit release factor A
MAAKMTTRKASKAVSRAKATRKSSVRSARKAPKVGRNNFPPDYIEIF